MKAMILAAGLGTRLRPLTDNRPKALVEVGGRTLLEITLARLREFGIREVIVNVHHFADMVVEFFHLARQPLQRLFQVADTLVERLNAGVLPLFALFGCDVDCCDGLPAT